MSELNLRMNVGASDGGPVNYLFYEAQQADGLWHVAAADWPSEAGIDELEEAGWDVVASVVRDGEQEIFVREWLDDARESALSAVFVGRWGGVAHVRAAAETPHQARAALAALREALPRTGRVEDKVPIYFWSYGMHGPQSIHRELSAPTWEQITDNYVDPTRGRVDALMTALRALVREWRGWCEAHYITDPEKFFGAHADYMLNMMTSGPMNDDDEGEDRWRLLILEDTGDLLKPDARQEAGQGLSRFLNAVDGLIGQGLRILVLVTTNEELGRLNEAVTRPGRTAARIEFLPFSRTAAREWLEAHGRASDSAITTQTLADLYAAADGFEDPSDRRAPVGFAS